MNENVKRLEEKIAYLERHVSEQDRAMLEMAEDIARLRRELLALRERSPGGGPRGTESAGSAGEDERPPHY